LYQILRDINEIVTATNVIFNYCSTAMVQFKTMRWPMQSKPLIS